MLNHINPAGRFRYATRLGALRATGTLPAGTIAHLGRHDAVMVEAFLPREIAAWRRTTIGWASTYVMNACDRVVCRRLADGRRVVVPYHRLLRADDDGRSVDAGRRAAA